MTEINTPSKNFNDAIYEEYFPLMKKTIWARPVDTIKDIDIIHTWMNRQHVSEFWDMAWSKEKIVEYLNETKERDSFDSFIAFIEDEPMAYFELYDPSFDILGKTYNVEEGDIGVHVLIGEEKYQRRYIIRLSGVMMRLVFHFNKYATRIVGEPDVNNTQIQGVMKFVGFKFIKNITLPDKVAALHSLDKIDFINAQGDKAKKTDITNNTQTNQECA